jgi:hypothetical protein
VTLRLPILATYTVPFSFREKAFVLRRMDCRVGVFNDEIVRHEVLCDRVEVRDHHHRAVAAAR